jgi:hypothetical protein
MYFIQQPVHIFQKWTVPRSEEYGSLTSKLTALLICEIQHSGISQRLAANSSYFSYLHTPYATSKGAVHLSLFTSESKFYTVI